MKKYLAFFALAAIIIGSTSTAHACSVMAGYPGTPVQNIANKDIAFIGTVQSVSKPASEYGDFVVTFKTEATYKGSVPSAISVRSPGSSAACGYDDATGTFTPNSVWMIYATGNAAEGYTTNAISLNTKYDSVATAVKAMAVAGLTPNVSGVDFNTVLKVGSRGTLVSELQKMLSEKGYSTGAIDGIFGQMTKAAVLKFQIAHNLSADGIVGMKTAASLLK